MTGHPGLDVPDQRGRTGLDQVGRDLDRNPGVVVRDVELTSQGWHVLRRVPRNSASPSASSPTSSTPT